MLNKAEIGVSIGWTKYEEAFKKTLRTLELLGEQFPQNEGSLKTPSHQIENLLLLSRQRDSQSLLKPIRCTDMKTFDVMALLSNLIETSRLCKNDAYQELTTTRMMNICLTSGFTPQYSISFAHYGAILMEQAFATNDFDAAKEGYRMGQICEKVAVVSSFYGTFFRKSVNANRTNFQQMFFDKTY